MTRQDFRSAGGARTTAHELANELATFAASLKDTARALDAEVQNIESNLAEIKEERDAAIGAFVEATLTDINGEQVDVLSALAAQDAEVGGQSLSFVRNKMVQERETALAAVNGVLEGVTDAEGVQNAVAALENKYEEATQAHIKAESDEDAASNALGAWSKAPEYKLVTLSDEIQSKGGLAVNQDNRAYYEPKDIFTAAYRFLTRDALYRDVRRALVAYGHEEDGKDAFAEMANYRAKTQDLRTQSEAATAARAAAQQTRSEARAALVSLDRKADDIHTDAQILAALRAQLTEDLAVPSYAGAVAAHYAEDFPQAVPLLSAKANVLEKLRAGAQEKLEAINANILAVLKQQADVAKLRAGTELNVDIEEVRRQNGARRAEYDNYTTATRESWNRTRSYEYNRPVETTTDRSGPDLLQWLLIMHILNDDNNRPSSTSSYTTDILKLDRQEAVSHGVSERAFDISPEVSRKMEELGITQYEKTGTFSFNVDDAAHDYVASRVDEAVRETVRESVREGKNFSFDAEPSPSRSSAAHEETRSSPSPRHS